MGSIMFEIKNRNKSYATYAYLTRKGHTKRATKQLKTRESYE